MKKPGASNSTEFLNQFCGRFDIPRVIVTDNAKNFDNAEVKELGTLFNIKHVYAAPRHPRGNAPAERAIQNVEDKVYSLLLRERLDREAALPVISLSINIRICKSTQLTPYELMFRREHRPVQTSLTLNRDPTLSGEILSRQLTELHAEATRNSSETHNTAKRHFDSKRRSDSIPVGTKVLCKNKSRRAKLSPKYERPHEIVSVEDEIYKPRKENSIRIISPHISQLERLAELSTLPLITMKPILLLVLPCFCHTVFSVRPTGLTIFMKIQPVFWSRSSKPFASGGSDVFNLKLLVLQ